MIVSRNISSRNTKIKIPDYIPVLGDYDRSVKGEIIIGGYGYRFRRSFFIHQEGGGTDQIQKFSKIVICVGALIMIILGMIVHDTWKDRIYFSLAVFLLPYFLYYMEYSCS